MQEKLLLDRKFYFLRWLINFCCFLKFHGYVLISLILMYSKMFFKYPDHCWACNYREPHLRYLGINRFIFRHIFSSFIATLILQHRQVPFRQNSYGFFLYRRSPRYFEPILNFLRTGNLILDPGVNPAGDFRLYDFLLGVAQAEVLSFVTFDIQQIRHQLFLRF